MLFCTDAGYELKCAQYRAKAVGLCEVLRASSGMTTASFYVWMERHG